MKKSGIVDEADETCREIIGANVEQLHAIANALEYETLTGNKVLALSRTSFAPTPTMMTGRRVASVVGAEQQAIEAGSIQSQATTRQLIVCKFNVSAACAGRSSRGGSQVN